MKIAFIAMGSSIHTVKWVEYFRDLGNEVVLISFYPGDPIEGVKIVNIPIRNRLGMILKVPNVKRLLKEFRPDILHAHYASSCGMVAALTGYHPFVLSTWGDDVMVFPKRSFLHRWLVRWAINKADHITATSRMLSQHTNDLVGNVKDIKVVPFGVDVDQFAFCDRSSRNSFHIGAVRWLTPKYGIDYLIKAVAQLVPSFPELHLTVVGKGYMLEDLHLLSRALGITKHVTFTGALPNDEVVKLLRTFDIFTMPSVSEGETFGVAAVEAMATGLPVVASRIGGLPEVVEDGVSGRLTNPADVSSLRDGLRYYLESPGDRIAHGKAGRARVEALFDWKKNGAMMNDLYQEIISNIR